MKYLSTFAKLCGAVFAIAGSLMGQDDEGAFTYFPDLRPCVQADRYEDFRNHIVKLKPIRIPPEAIDLELPSVFSFLCLYGDDWNRQDTPEKQFAFLRDVRTLIVAVRAKHEQKNVVVIGPGRPIIALLYKEQPYAGGRLDLFTRKGIDAFAAWFGAGATATVFKPTGTDDAEATKVRFLSHVTQWVHDGAMGTVWINVHGAPTTLALDQERGVRISVKELAGAVATGASEMDAAKRVDLQHTVWVFESCYSGDFIWRLIDELVQRSRADRFRLTPPALIVADQTRGRFSRDIDEEIVNTYVDLKDKQPHYWLEHGGFRLTDFSGRVAQRLFWRGREAVFDAQTGKIVGSKVVDPELLQQPVFVVPLDTDEQHELRRILGVSSDVPVRPFLEVR